MKHLNVRYYTEGNDKRYNIHASESNILPERKPPQYLRTQYQGQNDTKIRRKQKIIKIDNNELEVESYPKKEKPIIEKGKINLSFCPICEENWVDFDRGYYCQNCEFIISKQKHQIDRKVLRQDKNFSTRLPCANKKMTEFHFFMVNIKYKSADDMIKSLQQLKADSELKFHQIIGNFYDQMNYMRQSNTK